MGPLFEQKDAEPQRQPAAEVSVSPEHQRQEVWLAQRKTELNEQLDNLSPEELERYAGLAKSAMASAGVLSAAMQKRLDNKQFRAPMVWEYIRSAYAAASYGPDWKTPRNGDV